MSQLCVFGSPCAIENLACHARLRVVAFVDEECDVVVGTSYANSFTVVGMQIAHEVLQLVNGDAFNARFVDVDILGAYIWSFSFHASKDKNDLEYENFKFN